MLSVVEAWLLSTKPVLFSIANRDFNYAPLRSLFVPGVNWDFSYAELRLLFVPGMNWDFNYTPFRSLFDYAQSASSRGMLSGMKCSRSMAVVY